MTAAMLVLDPIFKGDLPPEQDACRPGRNTQQAANEVEERLHRGQTDVVDVGQSYASTRPVCTDSLRLRYTARRRGSGARGRANETKRVQGGRQGTRQFTRHVRRIRPRKRGGI